jgi:hypothetical protein
MINGWHLTGVLSSLVCLGCRIPHYLPRLAHPAAAARFSTTNFHFSNFTIDGKE